LHGIGPFLPWITRLLGEPDRQTLEAMHILWQESTGVRPGKSPLRRTIFDLARSAPTESALIQAQFPDAWFVLECDPANRAILGPVVVGPSGLTIAGKRLMDAAEPLEQVPDAQGRWCLFFGKHQIELRQKLPTAFLQELRRGLRDRLRIREEAIARAESTTFTPRTALLLAPLVQTCSLCQSAVIVRTGILGAAWTQFVVNPRG
ncbi:MAG: hypothetical protein LC104_19690, partial [Bacteroidales bacterium]|nr:hypothetical protein [Bacteroidales bacterium]